MTDTVVACLTPPGSAAIATLALRGPAAWTIIRSLFRPNSRSGHPLPEIPAVGRVLTGRLGSDLADEVVLGVKAVEPMPWVEIHCHGGPAVVELLLDTLGAAGARVCTAADFECLKSGDKLQAQAALALSEARTTRTAAILLDQYHGAFRRALNAISEAMARGDTAAAAPRLRELARYAGLGRHLTWPWTVVVAGAPNVGKSSLVNALAGYQRCIVASTPGTTRDVVTTPLAFDGWPVELADTAGLRQTGETLEGQGVEQARSAAAGADLCLWVLEASAAPVWPDLPMERTLLIVNKIDLPSAWDLGRAGGAVHVSARTGVGVPQLGAAIARQLVPDVPQPGSAVPFTPDLCDAIEQGETGWLQYLEDLVREHRRTPPPSLPRDPALGY